MHALEIFRNQGEIGRLDAELHGQIKAGGGFTAAGNPHQDYVRFRQPLIGNPVVVGQGVVDGFDPLLVIVAVRVPVGASHFMDGFDSQFHFQGADEGVEKVQAEGIGLIDDGVQLGIHQGAKDNGANAVLAGDVLNMGQTLQGLLLGVDEGHPDLLEAHPFKLGE